MPDEQRIPRRREYASRTTRTSQAEEILFEEGDPADANEFRRTQSLLDAQSRGRVLFANVLPWAALVIGGAIIITMLFHYLAPASWGWLQESQLDKLETAIASSATSAIIIYARRIFLP